MPSNDVIGKRFYRFISKFYYFFVQCVFELEKIRVVFNGIGIWPFLAFSVEKLAFS